MCIYMCVCIYVCINGSWLNFTNDFDQAYFGAVKVVG